MEQEVLVQVEGLSKKFCKSLKKSLRYGVQDLVGSVMGKQPTATLRKDEFWALKDINFELRRGECLGLIGHNGAGKSTLLKILNGLINPDQGKVTLRGRVGALIELGAGFNPILSGRENIYNNGAVIGFTKAEIDSKVEEIIDFAEIREFIDMPVQNYSSGMKVRLGFAVAAQMEPDVLIIDEVLAVGDLGFRMKCYHHIMSVLSRNVAIILVSHNIVDIMRLCDSVSVLERGKFIFNGGKEKGVSVYNRLGIGSNEKATSLRAKVINTRNSMNNFSTGDNLIFHIQWNSPKEIENAKMICHIEYSNIRLSSISSKYSDFSFDVKRGENSLAFEIEEIPLLVGGYVVKFELYGEELRDFVSSSNIVSFDIIAPNVNYSGEGLAHILKVKHRWSNL